MSLCREMMPTWEMKAEMERLTAENERLRQVLDNVQQARVLQGKAITEASNEIERLRAALHDLVGRCMDDFNGGRKLRRGDVDRARAALEGRT